LTEAKSHCSQAAKTANKARNLLAGAGAYYLSWLVTNPFAMGFGKLTNGIHYYGDFTMCAVLDQTTWKSKW